MSSFAKEFGFDMPKNERVAELIEKELRETRFQIEIDTNQGDTLANFKRLKEDLASMEQRDRQKRVDLVNAELEYNEATPNDLPSVFRREWRSVADLANAIHTTRKVITYRLHTIDHTLCFNLLKRDKVSPPTAKYPWRRYTPQYFVSIADVITAYDLYYWQNAYTPTRVTARLKLANSVDAKCAPIPNVTFETNPEAVNAIYGRAAKSAIKAISAKERNEVLYRHVRSIMQNWRSTGIMCEMYNTFVEMPLHCKEYVLLPYKRQCYHFNPQASQGAFDGIAARDWSTLKGESHD